MKAILEFNLPEERDEHLKAVNTNIAWDALDEISNIIRSHLKYDTVLNLESIRGIIISAKRTVDLE